LRKETGIQISDNIQVHYTFNTDAPKLKKVSENLKENIVKAIKVPYSDTKPEGYSLHSTKEFDIGDEKITITIYKK
jgi:hypothetical protein